MKNFFKTSLVAFVLVGMLAACSADRIQYNKDVYTAKSYTTDLAKYAQLPTCTATVVAKCKTAETLAKIQAAAETYEATQKAYTAALEADSGIESAKTANDAALTQLNSFVTDSTVAAAIQ